MSAAAKAVLIELFTSNRDPLADRSLDDKVALLRETSYRDYIKRYWGLDDRAADTFQGRPHDSFAMGIDRVSAYEAMETGIPGSPAWTFLRTRRRPPRWTSRTSITSPTATRRWAG